MNTKGQMGFCGDPNCEEYWAECTMCGIEFCTHCFPRSKLCPDCAESLAQGNEDDEDDDDFSDVPNLKGLLAEELEPEEPPEKETDR